jgi:transposase
MMSHSTTTIGIDIGDKYCQVCVLDGAGATRKEMRVGTTRRAIERALATWPAARVVMETGTHSGWIARLLKGAGYDVIVAHARQVQLITQSDRKNDRFDAEQLARLGRVDPKLLRPVEPRCEQRARDMTVLRSRDALVRMRTLAINDARGLAKSLGNRLPACSSGSFPNRVRRELTDPAVFAGLPEMLDVIERLSASIRALEQQIERMCRDQYPETALLRQVAGIGSVTALAFALTIGDPQRFPKSRTVGSYLGLCPRQRDSGQRRSQLSITKGGDRQLRRLMVQAAHYILGPFGPDTELRRVGLRLAARGGKAAKKRAVVAVARKLAVLLHRLWVTGEQYQPLGYDAELEVA